MYKQIGNLLSDDSKDKFFVVNMLFKLTLLHDLKENKLYGQFFKGQICVILIDDVQKQQVSKAIQVILLVKYAKRIGQSDINLEYF